MKSNDQKMGIRALSHRKIVTSSIKDSDKLINQMIRVASKEELKNTCLPLFSPSHSVYPSRLSSSAGA